MLSPFIFSDIKYNEMSVFAVLKGDTAISFNTCVINIRIRL